MTTGNEAPSDRRRAPGRPAHDVFESRLAAARAGRRPARTAAPAGAGDAATLLAPGMELVRPQPDAGLPRPRSTARHRRRALHQPGRHRSRRTPTVRLRRFVVALACGAVAVTAVAVVLALT
jgi:hypothetical protein